MSDTGYGCACAPGFSICSPRGNRYRTVMWCHYCKARRRMLVTTYLWYGPHVECCACGTEWDDGYRMPRSRSARVLEKRIRELKAEWKAETGTRATALAWLMEQVPA
jgi:hypothetical protein